MRVEGIIIDSRLEFSVCFDYFVMGQSWGIWGGCGAVVGHLVALWGNHGALRGRHGEFKGH